MYKTHVFLLVAFFKIAVNALIMKRTTTIVAVVFAERSKRLEADAMILASAKLWHRNYQTRVTNLRFNNLEYQNLGYYLRQIFMM